MATGVVFSRDAAQRIAQTVRKVEKLGVSLTGDRRSSQPQDTSFWAGLVNCDMTGRRYSWVKVTPVVDDLALSIEDRPVFMYDQPLEIHWDSAREVNGTRAIPIGAIVRLHFAGYSKNDEPAYLFQYTPAHNDNSIPIHDHRSNDAGGFAFAVMHPGTSLPMPQFAI